MSRTSLVVLVVLGAALAGFAGGLLVHMLGSITTEQVYLELTFLTLAMLAFGKVSVSPAITSAGGGVCVRRLCACKRRLRGHRAQRDQKRNERGEPVRDSEASRYSSVGAVHRRLLGAVSVLSRCNRRARRVPDYRVDTARF